MYKNLFYLQKLVLDSKNQKFTLEILWEHTQEHYIQRHQSCFVSDWSYLFEKTGIETNKMTYDKKWTVFSTLKIKILPFRIEDKNRFCSVQVQFTHTIILFSNKYVLQIDSIQFNWILPINKYFRNFWKLILNDTTNSRILTPHPHILIIFL